MKVHIKVLFNNTYFLLEFFLHFLKDLKNEDEEYKVFHNLVRGRRLQNTEEVDFKKWNGLMYLKVRRDISKLCSGIETKSNNFKS